MNDLLQLIDRRILWFLRYLAYKFRAGKLDGIGYLGEPSFCKGLAKLYCGSGFGIFPGWRIEIIEGRVEIGQNVRIGNNLLLNCGSKIIIGNFVTISANVFIGTSDFKISNNLEDSFKDWQQIERPVTIGNNCFIGFGAVILPGTVLESGCVVGANSVVRGSFKAGSVIAGNPARKISSSS
jgi:acetyltransferase-like isoleucine patch superfamily enzyme